MTLPRTSLVGVIPGPGMAVELRELPIPNLEPGSALLRVTCSEVCGTDVHLRDGRLAGVPYPLIPGHVSCGVLEKIRGTVTDVYGKPLSEGDRVTFLDVHKTCHRCWFCLVAKASTRCPERKVYGITYGANDGLCGGWSEYVYLKPGVRCIRLDEVSDEVYMAGGCSLPTALHAVQRANIDFADIVLVLGAGPVGLSAIAFSLLRGAARVLCIGAPDTRLSIAKMIGAEAALNFTTYDERQRQDWVFEQTSGRGADVTIECTGAPSAVTEAMRDTRDAGTVVIVGQYTDHGEASFNPHLDLNKKHLDVRGCWGSDYSHFHRAVEMLKTPAAAEKWSAIPLERFTLSQAHQAIDAVAAGSTVKALILPTR